MNAAQKMAKAKMEAFRRLVVAIEAEHEKHFAAPADDQDAVDEIDARIQMIQLNVENENPLAMLQNLADLAGCVNRFAALITDGMDVKAIEKLIEEHTV